MNKWALWWKVLFLEGLMLVSLGFGWGFGSRSGPSTTPLWVLLGAGFLGLLVSFVLWQALHRRSRRDIKNAAFVPISLIELERALRHFKTQPPLFDGRGLKSEYLRVDDGQMLASLRAPLLVEHWGGGDLIVQAGGRSATLSARQILRVEESTPDLEVSIRSRGQGESFLLLHFLSHGDGLE